jgi:hypothetical protein
LFPEFSVVKTLADGRDWAEGRVVPAGSVGTVVEVHQGPTPGYEVEFLDDDGYTWALGTYPQEALEIVANGVGPRAADGA